MAEELELLLRNQRWRDANEQTRVLLVDWPVEPNLLCSINDQWSAYSHGRFGFLAQRHIWNKLGGPKLRPGFATWEFFEGFGDEVGWRRDGMWLAWAGISPNTFWPTLDPGEIASNAPAGCLPFHDIMSNGRWEREFSPRDCWGEQVWDRWAEVLGSFA